MGVPILVVNNDPNTRRKMRQSLEVGGYTVVEAEDTDSGLAILRSSAGGMVVLFSVVLFNNIMAGTDGVSFLGAAAGDARLAHRHAFVIVTPTPEQVEAALGRLLDHLSVPIIAEPFDANHLLDAVAMATHRLLVSA